ncbi:zinc finger protein 84-like isoform X2 [Hemicordylus capensis]|nr:zinc finger protein 84-like isoform X2 [Hemicordylus capensis]
MPENDGTVASLGGFPIHTSELLTRLNRGEEAWIPDLQSSEESADEGPVKPTLKHLPKGGAWWDRYRSPMMYPSSDSSNSDGEQESEAEEEKPRRGGHRITILHRNVLGNSRGNSFQSLNPREAWKNGPPLKKHPRSQTGRIKSNFAEVGDINESTTKEKTDKMKHWNTCPDCGQFFKSKLSLSNHQRIHTRERPYQCSVCGEKFMAKKGLESHQKRHAEEKGYKHPNSNKNVTNHPMFSQVVRPHQCSECGKCYKRKDSLKLHQRSHTAERPHKCPECGKDFIRKEHLVRHQKIHMRQKTDKPPKGEVSVETSPGAPEKKPSTASVCEKTVIVDGSAIRPQGIQTNLYKCCFCGKCLQTKSLLVSHERTHTEERLHKCSWCKKSFHNKSQLQNHEKAHTRHMACKHTRRMKRLSTRNSSSDSRSFRVAENPFKGPVVRKIITRSFCRANNLHKCQYCEKCLSTRSALAVHERIHRMERPYKCHECGENFRQNHHLVRHQVTHARQKSFKHITPMRKLRLESSLSVPDRIHTRQKSYKGLNHGDAVSHNSRPNRHRNIPIENNIFTCQYCGKCMRTKCSLVSHERTHNKNKPYQCLECGKNFSQKKYLGCHKRSHMGKILPKCSDSNQKMTIKNTPLKHKGPRREKPPYLCLKCGRSFDEKYRLTRHEITHSGIKPFHCTTCGKGYTQKWHLKRHENIHLGGECHQPSFVAEVNHPTNGIFSGEKEPEDPPVNIKTQLTSRTVIRNASRNINEERTRLLKEGSEMKGSKRGEMHVKAQAEFQKISRKSKGKAQQNHWDAEVSVSQQVKSGQKQTRKDNIILHYKQDQRIKQQVQSRKSSKKKHGPQSCKKETARVGQQLRSRGIARRKSKRETQLAHKQARSCFCQQEAAEMTTGRKAKDSQTCRKVIACIGPPKKPHATLSSKLLRSASKRCEEGNSCFDQPAWRMFSVESKIEATGSPAQGSLACAKQQMEVLGKEQKGHSTSWSCKTEKCAAVDIAEQAELQASPQTSERNSQKSCKMLQAANELKSASLMNLAHAPGSCKKVRAFVNPQELQRTISRDVRNRAPRRKVVVEQNGSKELQAKHVCIQCKKSFRSRGNLLAHEQNHRSSRPFLCAACGKGFYGIASLTVHLRIHAGEKPFKCSECDFRCNVKSNLNKHKRTHAQKGAYHCLQCKKSFWFNHNLIIHSRIHNKKEPHKCSDCGRVFTQENFLKLHRHYKHHSETSELPPSGEEHHLASPAELSSCQES